MTPIKGKNPEGDLILQGKYQATLESVAEKNNGRQIWLWYAVIVAIGITKKVKKVYPANLDPGSVLKADLQVLAGREFNQSEIMNGVDPDEFVGSACTVVVGHKPTAGGKVGEIVTVVLPPEAPEDAAPEDNEDPQPQAKPSPKKPAK